MLLYWTLLSTNGGKFMTSLSLWYLPNGPGNIIEDWELHQHNHIFWSRFDFQWKVRASFLTKMLLLVWAHKSNQNDSGSTGFLDANCPMFNKSFMLSPAQQFYKTTISLNQHWRLKEHLFPFKIVQAKVTSSHSCKSLRDSIGLDFVEIYAKASEPDMFCDKKNSVLMHSIVVFLMWRIVCRLWSCPKC